MFFKEFFGFLKDHNIAALAMAFIMGGASTGLVNSLVKDIIMPLLNPLISSQTLKTAVLVLGPVKINYGSFLAELLNFVILGLIVFIVAKKILKLEKNDKKK